MVRLPRPREHQNQIIDHKARFKIAVCGRRWNKSSAGLICCVAGHGKRRQWIGAGQGGNVAWITSTNKNANHVIWPMLKDATKPIWTDNPSAKREQDKTIYFPTGGQITVWSAESPDSIRGDGLDGVVFDEAAFATAYLWFDVLRPALIDSRGWAFFATTPNGHNWFYRVVQNSKRLKNWKYFNFPSSANPFLSRDELSELEQEARTMGHSVEQELGAKFVKPGGSEWDSNLFDDHNVIEKWPPHMDVAVIAVDPAWGKKDGDYQAIVTGGFCSRGHGEIYLKAEMCRYGKKRMANAVVSAALELPMHPVKVVVEEPSHEDDEYGHYAEAIELAAKERGTLLTVESIPQTEHRIPGLGSLKGLKQLRIRQLDRLITSQRLRFVECTGTRIMLDQFVEFPSGKHDDGPDAAARAVDVLREIAEELV